MISCWGDNFEQSEPPSTPAIQQLALGETHSCALGENGWMGCWGNNNLNQNNYSGFDGLPLRIDRAVILVASSFSHQNTAKL